MNVVAARQAQRYRCRCERVSQVFGQSRHRRFYELDELDWERPVMTKVCPSYERELPTTRGLLAPEM